LYFLTDFTNVLTVNSNFCNLNSIFTNIKLLGFVLFTNFLYHFFYSWFNFTISNGFCYCFNITKKLCNKNTKRLQTSFKKS
jgi:hypothetical protein